MARPGSVLNCLWGHALKISPGIKRKSRVSHPNFRFQSSATWPSLPKKSILIDLPINQVNLYECTPVTVKIYLVTVLHVRWYRVPPIIFVQCINTREYFTNLQFNIAIAT